MRVLVVADGTMAQAGTAALVESIEGCEVAAAVTRELAIRTADEVEPDVCLIDLEGESDLEAVLEPLAGSLSCPLLAVCDEVSVGAAIAAGATGAVTPAIQPLLLGGALTAVVAGLEVRFPPGAGGATPGPLPGRDPRQMDAGSADAAAGERLTPREQEVLALLPAGLTNQQVAARLGISEHTAKFHVSAVLAKLGAQSRAEAVNRGYQLGLISI